MGKGKIEIVVENSGIQQVLEAPKGRLLKDLISDAGINFSFPCAGSGRCGKCIVTYKKGAPAPNSFDERFLSKEELSKGKRLLCRSIALEDCVISFDNEESMTVETISAIADDYDRTFDKYGIAVDIGTTTIAAALVGASNGDGNVLKTASCVNHQRKYGSDVIARIAASEDESVLSDMKSLVREDIALLVKELLSGEEISLTQMVIAGNTTMMGLFKGEDVTGLGKFPYEAGDLSLKHYRYYEFFDGKELGDTDVVLMPGISAFVGSDIVSGMYALDLGDEESALFIDLGTNGEMAFSSERALTVASTAAGPVFEAGGISCGTASIPGAISHVKIDDTDSTPEITTIADKRAIGICGTGVLEAVSELVRCGIVDETGLLNDKYFDEGYPLSDEGDVRISQEDIRNVQVAKAAIYTGISKILDGREPSKVFISGGFGSGIDIEKIDKLKIFPDGFKGKAKATGNTSLKGAVKYIIRTSGSMEALLTEERVLEQMVSAAKELVLAREENFNDSFVDAMNF
ncbi:ASKHA domain-containing protein [Butyrivibrio proteoclasticus]|uniref:ASKHA domain-containing protein n=1 Tax=Butyrivibrio proteoclasticus TaxID=43305 RepID=UPI00047BD0F9|nr:ASKHA domain-containing protein [Butyrivibrio proteoclasticus]